MSLYVRGKRARFLMNWIPIIIGILVLTFLVWVAWQSLNDIGQ
jgi:hypothetical protein